MALEALAMQQPTLPVEAMARLTSWAKAQAGVLSLGQLAEALGPAAEAELFAVARSWAIAQGWRLALKLPEPSLATAHPAAQAKAAEAAEAWLNQQSQSHDALAIAYLQGLRAGQTTASPRGQAHAAPEHLVQPGPNPTAAEELALLRWAHGEGRGPKGEQGEALKALGRTLLCQAFIRLVNKWAHGQRHLGVEHEDLVQEGLIGLLVAVDRFEVGRGFRFSTYASQWIRQHMNRMGQNCGRTVRLPVHLQDRLVLVRRLERDWIAREGEAPSDEALARAADLSVEDLGRLLRHGQQGVSLDAPLRDEDGATLGHTLAAPEASVEEAAFLQALGEDLLRCFQAFPRPEHAAVLVGRYGLGEEEATTLEAMGQRLGVTRERVRQIQEKCLRKLATRPKMLGWAEAYGWCPEAVGATPQATVAKSRTKPGPQRRGPNGAIAMLGWRPGGPRPAEDPPATPPRATPPPAIPQPRLPSSGRAEAQAPHPVLAIKPFKLRTQSPKVDEAPERECHGLVKPAQADLHPGGFEELRLEALLAPEGNTSPPEVVWAHQAQQEVPERWWARVRRAWQGLWRQGKQDKR